MMYSKLYSKQKWFIKFYYNNKIIFLFPQQGQLWDSLCQVNQPSPVSNKRGTLHLYFNNKWSFYILMSDEQKKQTLLNDARNSASVITPFPSENISY